MFTAKSSWIDYTQSCNETPCQNFQHVKLLKTETPSNQLRDLESLDKTFSVDRKDIAATVFYLEHFHDFSKHKLFEQHSNYQGSHEK